MRSYGWGLDLSGTMQGAGGIGGLLWVEESGGALHYPVMNGTGNVLGLISGADGTVTARYEYGPFGELIRQTGPMAKANPFRFSTKHTDEETELVYFGYRYYNPSSGRWISRDPLGEQGGLNLYSFVANAPSLFIDTDGRQIRIPLPVQSPIGAKPANPSIPFIPDALSKTDEKDLAYPSINWELAASKLNTIRTGNQQEARSACLDLAGKSLNRNQYYYSLPNCNRATGAAALLWGKDEKPRSKWAPPGFLAAKALKMRENVERGHLIPAIYGGVADARNIVTQDYFYNRKDFRDFLEHKIDARLDSPDNCNFVCIVIIPHYMRNMPVPYSFTATIVDRYNYFFRDESYQPTIRGNMDLDMSPWREMNLGITELNYQTLEAGF